MNAEVCLVTFAKGDGNNNIGNFSEAQYDLMIEHGQIQQSLNITFRLNKRISTDKMIRRPDASLYSKY